MTLAQAATKHAQLAVYLPVDLPGISRSNARSVRAAKPASRKLASKCRNEMNAVFYRSSFTFVTSHKYWNYGDGHDRNSA